MAEDIQLPKKSGIEIGYSGTLIFSGHITSEEYNRRLVGPNGRKQFDIMRRSDPTVHAALQIVKQPLLSTQWSVEPAKNKDGKVEETDQKIADAINYQLFHNRVNFYRFTKDALSEFDFGFSVFEKVFELSEYDGKPMIGIAKLGSRKQTSIYAWEMSDGKPGITQQTGTQNASIPREKLIIFTHEKEGDNDEGISLLRFIYKSWDMKDKLELVNAMSLEKQGMGFPIVTPRAGMEPTAADEQQADQIMQNVRSNERAYMKLPASLQFEFADMKGQTTKDILPTVKYLDDRIMSGVLARFMELGGSSGSGSQSLSKDLSSMFMKAEESVAREFAATVNEQLIKQLCDLNYTDLPNGYPKLVFGSISDEDPSVLAEALSALSNASLITADEDIERDIRRRFTLPEMSETTKEKYTTGEGEEKITKIDKTKKPAADKENLKEMKEDDIKAALKVAADQRSKLFDMLKEA